MGGFVLYQFSLTGNRLPRISFPKCSRSRLTSIEIWVKFGGQKLSNIHPCALQLSSSSSIWGSPWAQSSSHSSWVTCRSFAICASAHSSGEGYQLFLQITCIIKGQGLKAVRYKHKFKFDLLFSAYPMGSSWSCSAHVMSTFVPGLFALISLGPAPDKKLHKQFNQSPQLYSIKPLY